MCLTIAFLTTKSWNIKEEKYMMKKFQLFGLLPIFTNLQIATQHQTLNPRTNKSQLLTLKKETSKTNENSKS